MKNMKILIVTLILAAIILTARSQAVLEHVYPQQSVGLPVKLSNNEWVYPVISTILPITAVQIFSSNHVLLKTISLYLPIGCQFQGLFNVSDVLFNSDNKIEVLYVVKNNLHQFMNLYLINEDGTVIQEFPYQSFASI